MQLGAKDDDFDIRKFWMARMDVSSKVSMKGIGVSSKRSCQRPEMTEQVRKPRFGGQFRTQARHSYRRRPGDMY